MEIAADTPGQGASALPVPWNPTLWQHAAEMGAAGLPEVRATSAAGEPDEALLSAVSALALACDYMAGAELASGAIYWLGWSDAQQQMRNRPKRRAHTNHLYLVR